MNSMNAYVPKFMLKDFPWYERDGLMTWHDQGNCEDLLRDTVKNFQQAKIVNFDIIYRQCCGEEIPKDLLQYYQTVNDKTVSQCPNTEQDQILSSAFRTDRKDFFFRTKIY